ncbi:MAG: hypothetical protein UHN47_05725 [Lachnospiraceae bacterium]|nr:hypothetical protein [Lachnospiraceae bacterium]
MNTDFATYLIFNEPLTTNIVNNTEEQDCESNPVLFEKKDKE